MNRFNLVWILVLFLIPLVSAEFVYKSDSSVDLKVPCSNNNQACSTNATCNITIFSPTNVLLVDNEAMNNSGVYFNFTMPKENATSIGEYETVMFCEDNSDNDFTTFSFWVTPSGTIPSSTQGIIYGVGFIVVLALFIVCAVGAWNIDGEDKITMGGDIIEINDGKHIKLFLWGLSYILLWTLSFLAWMTAENFLNLGLIASFFESIFVIMKILAFPILLLFLGIYFMKLILDSKLHKLQERGLSIRRSKR